jgi:hypothetical protein
MIRFATLLCVTAFALSGSEPAVVWNLDAGPQGRTGSYSAFQSSDCEITVELTSAARRGSAGRGMKIAYRSRGGPCGVWMHLFDESGPAASRYSDTREYPFLAFWVRGETGLEDAEVRMADPAWLAREDSLPAGMASRYLGGPIPQQWREVVIPYRDFHLRSPLAAEFVLSFPVGSEGVLLIDDIALKRNATVPVPASRPVVASHSVGASDSRIHGRAMWLWETADVIAQEEERAATVANLLRAGVGVLFLQLPYTTEGPDDDLSFSISRPTELRSFLRRAHAAGIAVHALDGYPEFGLREMRPKVLGLVQAILSFNRESDASERFDGIHLDVEPYQLLGFDSPLRQNILVEFLELQREVRASLQRESKPLVYGIDIPFWLYEEHVVFQGLEREATRHLLEFVDSVGIMAYRRSASGSDGIVARSAVTVEHAIQARKKVYVGVETTPAADGDTKLSIVCTMPETAWWSAGYLDWPLLRKSNIDGFPLRSLTEGLSRSIGLAGNSRLDAGAYERALKSLALACRQRDGSAGEISVLVEPRRIIEKGAAKISFAGLTLEDLEEVIGEVSGALLDKGSFAGIAIHSYSSYENMR